MELSLSLFEKAYNGCIDVDDGAVDDFVKQIQETYFLQYLGFREMAPIKAIKIANHLSLLSKGCLDREIWEAVLINQSLENWQLFLIQKKLVNDKRNWNKILSLLNLKRLGTKRLFDLASNEKTDFSGFVRVMKTGKLSFDEIKLILPRKCKYITGTGLWSSLCYSLKEIYKLSSAEMLELARELDIEILWCVLRVGFTQYDHLLTASDLKSLLEKGEMNRQREIIEKIDVTVLRNLAFDEESSVYLVQDILASAKLGKEISFQVAKKRSRYNVWLGLFESGHFNTPEIIKIIDSEVCGHLDMVWEGECSYLDLDLLTREKLIEIYGFVSWDKTEVRIVEALKRKKVRL